MKGIGTIDGARRVDWSAASEDYARHRPPYPDSMFRRFVALGVGLPGQRVLDLGTGVGFLALELARRGAVVTGIDVAAGQIAEARRVAEEEGLRARFDVAAAEDAEFPDDSFDLVTAGQCWMYFDRDRVIPRVRRWLAPGGRLVTCHFSWLPRLDPIARRSEALVLRHNPDWSAADWPGEVEPFPAWARGQFRVVGFFCYDESVPFTRERWRGRLRASRGVGATLEEHEVRRFDEEHAELLERIAPEGFGILHRIDAHVLEPVEEP